MATVEIQITDAQAQQLQAQASQLGLEGRDLARAAVLDLIEGRSQAFQDAARHVVEKNAELYRRLS